MQDGGGSDVEGDCIVFVGGDGYAILGQLEVVAIGGVEGDNDVVRGEVRDVDVECGLGSGGKGDAGGAGYAERDGVGGIGREGDASSSVPLTVAVPVPLR